MAKPPKPIMTHDEERYMAFSGLLQWTQTCVFQSDRTSAALQNQLSILGSDRTRDDRRLAILSFHSECHFFVVAANKLIEFKTWALTFGLWSTVNFAEIDSLNAQIIRDLRNMREHVVDYFKGAGNTPDRWVLQTPTFSSDASSVVETNIGGRLDWLAFGLAAERLLLKLLLEPIPNLPVLD